MTYDNTQKYLVEQYPEDFIRYLLTSEATNIQILKTELNQEPIRADSVTFLKTANQILHLEFQTLPASTPPLPLRMLDYWVRLYRQYNCDIEQVVIFLKPTTSQAVFVDQFTARNTTHRYRVIRIWEQDPEPLLLSPGLLPLATLARTDSPQSLLQQVAVQVSMIEEGATKQSISLCTQLLAGLVFEPELIRQFLRREDMRESAIYQEILQEGLQEGRQRGIEQGLEQGLEQGRQSELRLVMRLLTRRLGSINSQLQSRLQELSLSQLEDLGEVLLDFVSEADLINWLNTIEN
ncbi:MAG: Rpn family recombination-promoting nuclease/putative transposase [Nostoc sp. DedVER02]|uniref:Rpn family recombination-promoting nuclease/putative transposase n=1 Tax=unclassified Nostoc TaxID=2593658 RepID=UPI002AD2ACB9|nr:MULTISPECIES: Rpn family recombination-promoting nuclease/putative transposase [unclassified Nostoc]MDZ7988906.1 Rpn family recombination-promoting nuclease/putative transposase [Nostoc sp. DedVER02]MDZ8112519.1 Rpn family recombination-promoting nuclease/putative transposase [Nostoc sp. DedVER01b]